MMPPAVMELIATSGLSLESSIAFSTSSEKKKKKVRVVLCSHHILTDEKATTDSIESKQTNKQRQKPTKRKLNLFCDISLSKAGVKIFPKKDIKAGGK